MFIGNKFTTWANENPRVSYLFEIFNNIFYNFILIENMRFNRLNILKILRFRD